jgi:hypothetical protein
VPDKFNVVSSCFSTKAKSAGKWPSTDFGLLMVLLVNQGLGESIGEFFVSQAGVSRFLFAWMNLRNRWQRENRRIYRF